MFSCANRLSTEKVERNWHWVSDLEIKTHFDASISISLLFGTRYAYGMQRKRRSSGLHKASRKQKCSRTKKWMRAEFSLSAVRELNSRRRKKKSKNVHSLALLLIYHRDTRLEKEKYFHMPPQFINDQRLFFSFEYFLLCLNRLLRWEKLTFLVRRVSLCVSA